MQLSPMLTFFGITNSCFPFSTRNHSVAVSESAEELGLGWQNLPSERLIKWNSRSFSMAVNSPVISSGSKPCSSLRCR